jgi:hypothetical protein
MNIYKIVFWLLAFFIYLFVMWFFLPNIGRDGMTEKGLEISYLLAVFQTHIAALGILGIVGFVGWLADKAGY